jgi:phenylacetate-CoA ligase
MQANTHDGVATLSSAELLSGEALRDRNEAIWRRQLARVVASSPFYRSKFDGLEPDEHVTLTELASLPFTEKTELRASLAADPPLGRHRAADPASIVQIQATSGTTGTPSYFGLTRRDLAAWAEVGARGLYAAGFRSHHTILHAMAMSRGFAGGAPSIHLFERLGACFVPIGAESGADRLLTVLDGLGVDAIITGPNFALHLGEMAPNVLGRPAHDLGVERLVVGGEPGGGEATTRDRIESIWGATCTETLGNSDVIPLMWAECLGRSGMHWCGQEYVHVELIDPVSGQPKPFKTGATGELVYTALQRESAPLIRFRSRDHIEVLSSDPCDCGRPSPRIRCFGRTDDMLIVRGVNVWPAAVRDIVASFHPRVSGTLRVLADFAGHVTDRHLRVQVETSTPADDALREEIESRLLSALSTRFDVQLVAPGAIEHDRSKKIELVQRVPGEQ